MMPSSVMGIDAGEVADHQGEHDAAEADAAPPAGKAEAAATACAAAVLDVVAFAFVVQAHGDSFQRQQLMASRVSRAACRAAAAKSRRGRRREWPGRN